MRIGDAAAAAGTTPRALRFYEQNGLLLRPPRRTATGQREYGPREVARIRVIRELLSLGLTVADIRDCADRLDLLEEDTLPPYGGPGACAESTGVARRRLAALDAEIERLTRIRENLAARLDAVVALTPGGSHRTAEPPARVRAEWAGHGGFGGGPGRVSTSSSPNSAARAPFTLVASCCRAPPRPSGRCRLVRWRASDRSTSPSR